MVRQLPEALCPKRLAGAKEDENAWKLDAVRGMQIELQLSVDMIKGRKK